MMHILYFTAEWCNPCKRVRPIAEELEREGLAKFQYIDADDNPELCKTFEIRSVPTFIVVDNNEEIRRTTGAKTREELEGFINGSN